MTLVDIKICFSPKETCPKGFVLDKGDVYQSRAEYEYGWEYN